MGRAPGAKNRDHDQTRRDLARLLGPALIGADGEPATFKDLASAARVSQPTLRHYFPDALAAYRAAMAVMREDSAPYRARMADPGDEPVEVSLVGLLEALVDVWVRFGLGRLFGGGLARGLHHEVRGPAFVSDALEPLLVATEARLAVHVERGELAADLEVRGAALRLVGPVVLGLLHQDNLGGRACRPLDVKAFARDTAAAFLRSAR